jgi:hypothetical protein
MAYNNDQSDQPLPGGNENRKRQSASHLPKYYRTPANKKFLASTMDQLIQPGVVEKLNGYVGRKTAKAFSSTDNYVSDVSDARENYQLEPASIVKDNLGNVTFYKDYNDYINQLDSFNKGTSDHSVLNQQEYYAWDPHVDWDKLTNFREYYWLPNGPQSFGLPGNTIDVESTYTVRIGDNADNNTYIFSPDGLTNNPTITLYRGITYKFDIDTPNLPFTIKTKKTLDEGFDLDSSSILVLEGVSVQGLEKGTSTLQLGTDTPDILYYMAANDLQASGTIVVKDISEATFIDVEKEILGKKTYKASNDVVLSNGMKVFFTGEVEPASYAEGAFYVEGVGDKIKLVPETNLNVPTDFTDDVEIAFDAEGFDRLPFGKAIGYPTKKDYLVINRSAKDGNLWARYNRWFHKSVIETSAVQNNQPSELDQLQRAKRPIIEFEADIKLHNFGTKIKKDVDLIDNFTTDVFSTIEGGIGYNIDGINIVKGMRILFTADTDILVKGRIFEVDIIKFAGGQSTNNQITLKEVADSIPQENETVLALNGNVFKGKMLYFQNGSWQETQQKTNTNQPPLFDIFDSNGKSYSDTSTYEASTFSGNKLFSYKQGIGSADTELGFPLSYRSISNVGDIVFNYDILQDTMTYTNGNDIFTVNTDIGFLRKYSDLNVFETISGWKKVTTLSEQPVIQQYVFDNTTIGFEIDVYNNSGLLSDLWVRVYLNNKLQFENVDYTITTNIQNNAQINFNNTLTLNDDIVIKTKSKTLKNDNGFYEIPTSLERNPKNENLKEFTLGEVNDHVSTIVENLDNFAGVFPGPGNLRDLSNLSDLGRRFLQHSAPMNLSLYHITDKDSNIIKSLDYARTEYNRFKREFLQVALDSEFQGSTKDHVDSILQTINSVKSKEMPFYFSDMVPTGAVKKLSYTILDANETFFALSEVFDNNTLSKKAVSVYKNNTQLVYNKDYTFNSDGFAVVTATKAQDDVIDIFEYETTNGSYVPPTPTKLGLYPAYEPMLYSDDTYLTTTSFIQGHDGSRFVAFNDYRDDLLLELEKRIFNNIKIKYDTTLLDINDLVPGEYRQTGVSFSEINKSILSNFLSWSKFIDTDYTLHNFFERTNTFTFNYSKSNSPSGNTLPGFWRQIYKRAFDTDRPHTHPWEMLGLTIKPSWWETQYGPAPYTKDNLLMWTDLQNGILRQPGVKYKILNKYKRLNLLSNIPSDESGNLLPPLSIGWISNYQPDTIDFSFVFGDGAPVESAWRNSSDYAFSIIKAFIINKPSLIFSTGFDRFNQVRNSAGSIVYKPTNKRINLKDLVFPSTSTDATQTFTSGLVNYVASYMAGDVLKNYEKYKENITSIDNQIGFKLAGFTDIEKFKLILDSRTPTNEGNVFVPNENYQIFLNTSSPIKTVEYSGVIIERRTDGYVIKGYSPNNTIFKYLSAVSKQNDPSINVGGISENYVVWNSGKTYIAGQNVEYQGSYYRTKTQHQSTQTFDETQFAKLAALPLKGGREAFIRKQFTDTIIKEMLYGTLLTEIQDVVDFLLGYGEYLKSQGFIFDYFQGDNKVVLDWRHCVNEFLFWTTQNWAAGSVITLSPGAEQIKITTNYSMVDNIFDGFYGYGLFKADGQKLVEDFANLGRSPNEFSIGPKNTADGIYFISLPLVQKEHVVIIDNATVFGDVIFDQQPGYRQERIKILGYRTTDWDGSLNIPGFIFDEPNIVEWEQWQDYNIGAVVKNKEFYYSAPKKVPGSQIFDAKNWNVLSEKPEGGLYANFEYKTNQFADFYDLDSDNFDVEQQKMAQHLIGYQKRQYLQNIVNDDVSQYKFYQGFIQDKGSKNALTKLFDALASDDKDSLEFYEEWAIKDGQYGASEGFDDVIFRLDEGKFRLVPQPIQLVNSTTGEETDLIYRIKPYEVYQKSKNYDHKPLPGKYVFDSYTKNAGYVNQQDVRGIVTNYENILDFNFADIAKNAYIWVGNQDKDWTVYKHVDTPYVINQIGKGEATFDITVDTNVKDFVKGDIIGINAIHNDSTSLNLDRFYKIDSINNNVITVETDDPKTTEDSDLVGNITVFLKVRATNVVEANKIVQTNLHGNDLLWIDSITDDNEWAVYKNTNSFVDHQRINNPVSNAYGNIESITLDVASTTIFNQGFHKLSKYDRITFSGIEGTVELNSTSKYVGGTITSSSFQLYDDADLTIPTNSSSFTAHTFKTGKWVNNGSNFGTAIAVDDRNTTLLVSTPDDADGKVYVYNRPTNALTYTLTQTIEPFKFGNDRQRFGAGLAISPDGEYVVVGSPNASNVKTKYSGAFQSAVDYPKNSIVGKDQGLWRAKIDIQGEEDNIVFNSFSSVVENIQAAGLQNNNTDFIPALIIGDYAIDPNNNLLAFNGLPTNHILVRAPFSLYEGSGINDQVRLQWNSITYGNQDLSALTARAPFNGSHSVITDAFLSQEHTIQKKIDEVLYVNSSTTSLDIGDVLQTPVATGIVEYTKLVGAELLIYLRDVNGTFNTSDSLFRDDGDFIGEYVKQGPIDPVNTSTVWGGYWWIDTPVYTPTSSTTNIDKGAGLVYWDLISDSTPTGRYYYSSLDYLTTDISSQNTFTGYIRTLTYRGLPGAGGSNDTFSSNLYVMRAPKALSDTISPGDPVSVYVNQLPQYTTGDFKDLTTIGLSSTTTNTTRNVYDVWDGYINLDFTKTDAADNPFEPRVGDTVRDLTTGATAEVIFYQRNSLNATIFVKNLAGTFSVGDDYGQNAEIEFLGTPGDPDVNYQIDRVMGEIQFTSLGYTPAGIGKMLVFDSGNPISLSAEDNINEIEYWMYTDGDVLGIPRLPNPPSSINNDWEQVYRIPAESTGTSSGFTNQGLYTVYSRSAPGRYDEIGTYTVPEQQSNFKLGSNIKIAKNSNGLYRTMVHAEGTQTQSLPGRIYFIKTGTENNITYTWEYAKNKKYKGVFNESINYFTKDIVYRENPAVSGTGVLYVAKTNLAPGPFSITDWTSTDDLIDYVGFIPNSSGTSVINDSTDGSTVLDQGLLSTFGNEFDINKNGDVLIANALYDNTKPNQVVVYRQNNGFWERGQEIQAPDKTSGFGKAIAISDDGMYIAVSEPFNDDYNADQGKVSIYHQVNGVFTFLQDLQSPNNERAERFGWKLQYDGNKLFVTSRNADSTETTTFDSNTTRFDNSFTEIVEGRKDVGVVFVYEKTPNGMLFAQTIQIPDSDVNTFGRNIHAKQNHFYVGLETKVSENSQGQVIDFRIDQDVTMWETHRSSNKTVDVEKIKKIFLYNIKENELLTYLDYIDPIQGKVAGPAEQELTYKTYFDPAVYTNSSNIGAIQDQTAAWGTKQVGEVWWNLTTAKFTNPYQGSIQYATQSWNKVFQGNSIDIYEWVESDILPSAWDAQADTETGFAKGYSGKSLYGDSSYSTRRVYNEILKTFKTMYYFWVTDKTIVPNVEFRKIDTREIAQYITDPAAKGHRFVALISPEKFVLYNCEPLIKGTDVAINIQFWTIKNQNQNVHNQYQIVSEGLETSQPNPDVVIKWFDSLIGYDAQSRVVPDPTLSDKEKYGSLNRPRQSWFKNKNEALKQVIERVNLVLTKNLIIDDKDISKLSLNDPILTTASNLYDVEVETVADLATVGTDKIERAVLSPVIKDGKITDVTIINPGKGYRYPPAISISGNGTDAELLPVIDGAGKIISVTVLQQGTYYDSNTILTVRNFAVLVKTDETLLGKWALYERENRTWNRIRSQSYNVGIFWNYVDWYATGYNEATDIDYLINNSYELTSLDNTVGSIVKISNIGTGGWLLIEKISNNDTDDYTQNYKTIGRQNGTINFKNTLYDSLAANTGFDTISFDTKIFDSEPIKELRIILNTIKDDILIDELLVEFNKLFFASLRYVFAEQTYVDWAFKTSFIKAKHNVGKLREDITFNNDNLPSYEAYVKEVKPFATKIREYLSAYEGIDPTRTVTTDFDLPASYNSIEGKILPKNIKVIDDVLVGTTTDLETYPNKNWLDNSSYSIVSVKPVDGGQGYTSPPVLTLTGGGGTGTVLKTYLGTKGDVTKVDVVVSGSGYYSTPVISVNGNLIDGGRDATFSVELGNNPVRGITTTVKFDRTTGTYVYTQIDQTQTFTASGSQFEFNLNWPIDLKITDISVFRNNIEQLSNEYTYTNILDATASYERYYGQVSFTNKPDANDIIVINYKLSPDLYQAADRISNLYNPQEGQLGKELSQLMTGIDYGGVEVKSFGMSQGQGWDSDAWFGSTWDSYDNTYNDEIFELGDSTTLFNFSKPLETGVEYHVYRNNVRIDDPNFGTAQQTNPNALVQSITGAGQTAWSRTDDDYDVTNYVAFDEEAVPFGNTDVVIFRKSTSDGTFLPNEQTYDSIIQGGNLNYSTATGLESADITIDGDGFVTPTTSAGPEEQVPGQLLDTVDIKVFERPKGGGSQLVSTNYNGNGSKVTFDIGSKPLTTQSVFVKVAGNIQKLGEDNDYTIDFNNNTITLASAPAINSKVNIVTLGVSGTKIIDIDTIVADGSTTSFMTNVRYKANLQNIITMDGLPIENVVNKSKKADGIAGNALIKFAIPPTAGTEIKYVFFEDDLLVKNYSEVNIETITADGSSLAYDIALTPSVQQPLHFKTIVKAGNKIFNAGYNQRYITKATTLEYKIEEWQFPPGSLDSRYVEVYLNGVILDTVKWNLIVGASTVIRLKGEVQQQDGDILDVFVMTDGEYRFGYVDSGSRLFVKTPNQIYFDTAIAEGTEIQIFTFNNHDYQDIQRISYDVVDRINLVPGTEEYQKYIHLHNGLIKLNQEAIDAQYLWVSINGQLLTPSVDYFVTDNKQYVKIESTISENDVVQVVHFAASKTQNKFGWSQFKDMLNRTHYIRINNEEEVTLAKDLYQYDQSITVINGEALPSPVAGSTKPAIIMIDGERIEYFVRNGNVISQFRRGTLGTGVKNMYPADTVVLNISGKNSMPYKDETLTTIFTADGTSSTYELDFTPNNINEFEVFVAGKRLRKNSINNYIFNEVTGPVALDSPEGDETLSAEFTINSNQLVLTSTPIQNTKVIVVRKQGQRWSNPGIALADSDSNISRFLRAATVDLPR